MRRTNKSLVKSGYLLDGSNDIPNAEPIQIGSAFWFAWLCVHNGFVYEGKSGHFTARTELRRGTRYWYGYRRREGKLTKTYLGKSEELTLEHLEQSSARLAGQVSSRQLTRNGSPDGLDTVETAGALSLQTEFTSLSANGFAELSHLPLTKFKPPALPQKLISRPNLTQRINAPVTLVSAPSGFGKTTLLNEWAQTSKMPVAWVTLDAEDNHPQHFWITVVTAIQVIYPGFGNGWLSKLRSSSPPSLLTTVTNLTNDIIRVVDKINGPSIGLVLDDFHHIQRSELHSSLQTWLEQIPPKFNLVIASNIKLPLTLGYLRAKGTVIELKTDDLRFSLEEGVNFLNLHVPGQPLAYSDMQTLFKRTEGWISGLVLATSILSQQDHRSRIIEIFTGAHTFLREFFMESVLYQQAVEVQNFLLKTSILEHMTGPLCDAVTGRGDGEELLARLWEESLFLERLEKSGWYRYHEMFAEMLRTQLSEQFPAEIPRLHRKAAKWYRSQASLAEAIHHLLLSKSWEEAATLIEAVALSELEQLGEDSRLLRWIQQLPETVIQQHKTLLVVYVRLARLGLPPKEVENFLLRVEMNIISIPVTKINGALHETLTEIRRIRHLWASDEQAILSFTTGREQDTVGQMLDGILKCHRDCRVDLVKAEAEANKVYETALAKSHLFSILMAGGECANLAFSQGYLRRSEQIAYQVLQQASELRDKLPGTASIALTALSGVHFERNQIAQARQFLERAIEVDPDPISANESISMGILRAKIQSTEGNDEAAFATLQAIRENYSHHPSNIWLDQDLIAYQALFRLHQGDLAAAEGQLRGGWEIDQHPFSAFIRASILVDQGRNLVAEEILNHLLDRYPDSVYWMPILRARVKLSIALFNQQKINQARQVMSEAARLAAPEFFVRPFLSPEPQVPQLLSLILHTESLSPGTRLFVKGTLRTLGNTDEFQKTLSGEEPEQLVMAASISPREQEILQLVSRGLSNQEIAAEKCISTSTVKTHLVNIYRKLEVNNRTQAISRARAIKLV